MMYPLMKIYTTHKCIPDSFLRKIHKHFVIFDVFLSSSSNVPRVVQVYLTTQIDTIHRCIRLDENFAKNPEKFGFPILGRSNVPSSSNVPDDINITAQCESIPVENS